MTRLIAVLGIGIVLVVLLTGCVSGGIKPGDTPSQQAYYLGQQYNWALSMAAQYQRLPSCETVPPPCSSQSVLDSVVPQLTALQPDVEAAEDYARACEADCRVPENLLTDLAAVLQRLRLEGMQ